MKNPPSPSPLAKGQMRCHTCRCAVPIKDGEWKDRGSQQVFLCKSCAKKPEPAARPTGRR